MHNAHNYVRMYAYTNLQQKHKLYCIPQALMENPTYVKDEN